MSNIKLFQEKKIRSAWNEEEYSGIFRCRCSWCID